MDKEKLSLLARLKKHIEFLKTELSDYEIYNNIEYKTYFSDRRFRREFERWIENIILSIIDISKIILNVENINVPDTYRKIVEFCEIFLNFEKGKVSNFVPLRNVIVHEYLDIKWARIEKFLKEINNIQNFVEQVENYINFKKEDFK